MKINLSFLYKKWRLKIFLSMFFCYIFFYFSRKSLIFMSHYLISDLNFSIYWIGFINSLFYIIYAFSKFLFGIFSDKFISRNLMFIGLAFTGFFNFLIGISSNIILIAILWFLNAFFQGMGWPFITKQLTYWYNSRERGFWWGLLSISHNIGGAIIPVIIGFLSLNFFWRFNFFIIGFFCFISGIILYLYLKNIPNSPFCFLYAPFSKNLEYKIENIFYNKYILLLCLSYFFIYVIKTAFNDWLVFYMISQREHDMFSASFIVFYFEFGGIFGIIFSGVITDKIFNNRIIFLRFSAFCLFIMSLFFYNIPYGFKKIEYIIIFVLGFLLFSQQMLIGLIASESVYKKLSCTANGFVGCFAYIGAAFAGLPFSIIINVSWTVYFVIIFSFEIILIFILFFFTFIKEKK